MYNHEGGDLFEEDVEQHMAVLTEVAMSSMVDRRFLCRISWYYANRRQDKLRQLIWKSHHPLIRKGKDLLPASRGADCDIDVGGLILLHNEYDLLHPNIGKRWQIE